MSHLKKIYVQAVKTRLKPNKVTEENEKWITFENALKKLTIDELSILEELIMGCIYYKLYKN